MGFWDWWDNEPERIAGTPSAAPWPGNNGGRRTNPWARATRAANRFQNEWDNRGDNLSGGTFTRGMRRPNEFAAQRLRDQVLSQITDMNTVTTDEILAELGSLQDPSRYMSDQGSLARQAMELASAQYDPLIAQLESAMSSAQSRANRNKTEIGNMFNALSTNLQEDVPKIQQQYATDKAESQQTYDQLQNQLKSQYDQSAAEQEAMMQRLNIQAAAPDVLPEQQRDRDYFTNLAARDAGIEQQALGQEERAAVNYTQQGSQIARAEGTQRQADLMSQLQDLLNQYQGQIGAQRAAKQSSYMAQLLDLQNNAQTSATEAAQRDFDNYISMIQLGRGLRKDEGSNKVGSVKSPADVAGRALGMGLPESNAQRVQDIFTSAIGSDPQILSGTGIFGQSVPKEALAQRVVEAGRKNGLNSKELNALQVIALEYFGRR